MAEKTAPIKAGVVGAGIGKVHVEGYQKSGQAEVVAICDANQERAQKLADEFGVPKTYANVDEMLANENLDAVSVCVPNSLHADIAIAALNAGAAVICEKPMANTLENAERLAAAVQATGGTLMMGYNNRHRSDSRAIRQAMVDGALGRVYYAKCGWVRRQGIPGMGGWFTKKAMSGGGPMMDIGVHALDLTMWLLGFPKVLSVSGSTYAEFGPRGRGAAGWWDGPKGGGEYDVEDLATGFVRLENGATLLVEASWAQFIAEDKLYSSLYGTEGGADLNPFRFIKDVEGKPADTTPDIPSVNGHHTEVAYFVDCLLKGETPDGTPEQGLAVMRLINALYQSAKEGREVRLDGQI